MSARVVFNPSLLTGELYLKIRFFDMMGKKQVRVTSSLFF